MSGRPSAAVLSAPELAHWLRSQASPSGPAVPQIFAVSDVVAGLLPEPGLRAGSVYSLDGSGALLLSLLAEPSAAGSWCGVIGIPELGTEAAAQAGVALDRLVLVPHPGARWLSTVAALAEVLAVIAVRPSGVVRPADATRLAARLRDRQSVLLVVGEWPRVEASFRIETGRWVGLGEGYGHLVEREVRVAVASKRWPQPRRATILLPGSTGRLGSPKVTAVGGPLEMVDQAASAISVKAVG